MDKTIVDDGFSAHLVSEAEFDGDWEIPIIKNNAVGIPKDIILFDKMKKVKEEERSNTFLHFYMHDITFRPVITNTEEYVETFKSYGGIISPDCSLYIDMPLCLQMANTYLNRAVGAFIQNKGVSVIPNVRWGDERTYDFAFLGLEKGGVYAVSTVGCIRSTEEKVLFKQGLQEMIKRLVPKQIIVHGTMPESVFKEFEKDVEFINYEGWTSRMKKGGCNGN